MVSYVSVFEEDAKFYKNVVPDEKLIALGDDENYMIGAVNEDGQTMGAVCFSLIQDLYDDGPHICIDWLYVDKDYRSKGYGHGLIEEVKQLSVSSDINDLRAEIPYPDVYDNITDFFRVCGFDFIYTDSYEFRFTIDDYNSINLFKANIRELPIIQLKDVPNGVYNEGIIRLAKHQLGENYKNVSLDRDDYDGELSLAYVSGGRMRGIFLMRKKADGTVDAMNLFVESENIRLISFGLMKKIGTVLSDICPSDTVFRIKSQREPARKLMAFLLPEHIGEIVRKGRYTEE